MTFTPSGWAASLAMDGAHAGPLYAWHLVDEDKVAHLLSGNPNLVWRPHTHRYFPPLEQKRVRWLLCLLRRVFPAANHDVRNLLLEYAVSRHWYERQLSAPPPVDLDAPWKTLLPLAAAADASEKAKESAAVATRRWHWIEAAAVAGTVCAVVGWLLWRKRDD